MPNKYLQSGISLGATLALATVGLATANKAQAVTLNIDSQANIFGSGKLTAPAPDGGGGGILPPSYSFSAAPGQVLTFSNVTGSVSCCNGGTTFNGPDGGPFASGTTDILSYQGISGIIHDSKSMFLVGVFLDDNTATDPAPGRLNFSASALGDNFAQLSPQLGQTFFIGDGLTDTDLGTVQEFFVPTEATRLFLGFADALEFGNPTSLPGFYGDNVGSLTAEFQISADPTAVPEPLTLLGASAAIAFGAGFKRRKSGNN